MDNIDKIRILTDSLEDMVKNNSGGFVEYDVGDDNVAIGFNLYHAKGVAVQRVFATAGTVIALHEHKEAHEYMVVVSGRGITTIDGVSAEWEGEGFCHFPPGSQHTVEIIENTWAIAVVVPAIGGFPNAG